MIEDIKHLVKLLIRPSYRKHQRIECQLREIVRMPRYKQATIYLFEKPFTIVDSASFSFIYNEIFKTEIYKFVSHNSKPYIIDCGANIGLSILFFKKLYPDAQIVGFEPDLKIFQILNSNVNQFGLKDVQLIPQGVWNKETTLQFFSEGADGGRIATRGESGDMIEIKTTRLRPYINKPVDFLKIDIEGAEVEVLKDCEDLLAHVDNLFIEYHSFVDRKQELDVLLKLIANAGFRYYILHNGVTSSHPFVKKEVMLGMDSQLNIYASRSK